jgi:hypothetical protein
VITRRQALGAGIALVAQPAAAFAATTERAPLAALVAYQQQVVFGYQVALRKGPFGTRDRAEFERFLTEAQQAATALRKALEAEGGTPSPPQDPATAPPPSDPTRRGYLADLMTAEEMAVASYYASLQSLQEERHLRGCAAFMAQAGRHLVVLRQLAGRPLLPRAFETGA